MDSVRVLVAKGRGIARVSRAMGVSCAQRNVLPTGRTGAVTGVMTTQTRNTVGFPQYLSVINRVMVIDASGASGASKVRQSDNQQ